MMHGRGCSPSFERTMRPSWSHRRSTSDRRFRSRRLHHLHHSCRRGRECRGVRPNFIRVFEVELPSANSLQPSASRARWLITSSVDSNGQWMRWFGFRVQLGRSIGWLVGWLVVGSARWIRSRHCESEPARTNVETYYSVEFKGRFRFAGAEGRVEHMDVGGVDGGAREERVRPPTYHWVRANFTSLKIYRRDVKALIKAAPARARLECPPGSVSFPERPRGRNDPSPRFPTTVPHTTSANSLPFSLRAAIHSFLPLRRSPYTFVMFSANSPGNFPNKIRVPTGRPSSHVRRYARFVLLKRRCFQKYANVLTRCSDYVRTKMFLAFARIEGYDSWDQSFYVIGKR